MSMYYKDIVSVAQKTLLTQLWRKYFQMLSSVQKLENTWFYLVCQFGEVLLCVTHHVSHSEDGAVGVVDHVEVTFFNVIVSDGGEEVPSAHTQEYHMSVSHQQSSSSSHFILSLSYLV